MNVSKALFRIYELICNFCSHVNLYSYQNNKFSYIENRGNAKGKLGCIKLLRVFKKSESTEKMKVTLIFIILALEAKKNSKTADKTRVLPAYFDRNCSSEVSRLGGLFVTTGEGAMQGSLRLENYPDNVQCYERNTSLRLMCGDPSYCSFSRC